MNKIKGFFKLVRFELPLSAGICVIMGQILALGDFPSTEILIFASVSVFLISASILVMNDYFDVESDKINAPHRPIPSKLVSPYEALIFAIFILAAGLLCSYLLTWQLFLVSVILTLIGYLYNRYFKKSGLPGNLMVSFSVGMTFIYGGVSVGSPFSKAVLFFGLIAALIDLGEEIAADAMDSEGDRLIESKSIAIKYGERTALKISLIIFFTVIALSLVPFILNWFELIYLIPIAIMDFSIAYPACSLLNASKLEARKLIKIIYLGSTVGIVVFIIMRLIGI
jgi:geranylgeranylglycerol-phosphate geranylgeranyltransferase